MSSDDDSIIHSARRTSEMVQSFFTFKIERKEIPARFVLRPRREVMSVIVVRSIFVMAARKRRLQL